MRRLPFLLGLGAVSACAFLAPLTATASPAPFSSEAENALDHHPLRELVARESAPQRLVLSALSDVATRGFPRPFSVQPGSSSLDCIHAKHDITLDPQSGITSAHLDLEIRAVGHALSSVGLSFDEGLHVGTVTADGHAAQVSDATFSPTRMIQIDVSPPLQPGESTVLHIPYAGTLECGTYPEGGGILCTKGDDFSYFAHQSLIPYLFDPADPQGSQLDALTRDIVLRVPALTDVISTGEKVSDVTEGETKISTWTIDHPLSRALGMYVFAGKLGMKPVAGRSVPTTFVFPNPELPVDSRLVSWSAGVLDFVEKVGGGQLPFQKSLTLVRLPANVGDPGTATFGMTLLSESYARAGDLMHEETWAHENSHLFWGIVVPETSTAESRLMSEGLATLSQLDYTYANHFAGTDRDTYLARRFVPIGLDLRSHGQQLPPVAVGPGDISPDADRSAFYTMWAYYKTSAMLDHLRVTIGDDAFTQGLQAYVKKCSYVGCRPDDLRTVLETETGRDLLPFFDRWVTASTRPKVTIGFAPTAGGADIVLSKGDSIPMTLELWLRLDDGQLVKQRVDLKGHTTNVHIATSAWVRTVSASPRHDLLVDAVSASPSDLDFDGETDGVDLLRCTPLVGRTYESPNSLGLWNVDERFDPRCDVNGDLKIDTDDIDALAQDFGTLRHP